MDAAGVIATYVMDGERPLTAESNGNTTFYLYGLGGIGEKTTEWNFSLPDGTNTPRQLTNINGEITLSSRYNPWGDTLETYGTGNFSFGYLGGVLDATTGLLYVGNGQYYDPATGRFLTRDVNPNSTNPYVPWNPIGAILGPLGLIALVFGRRKKGSKAGTFLVLVLVVGSVGMTLAGCGSGPTEFTVVVTPDGTATITFGPTTVIATATLGPGGAVNVTAISCLTPLENVPAPTSTSTPTPIPTATSTLTPINDPDWNTKLPEVRAPIVWNAICQSGGWWGNGRCPTEKELVTWLLFEEGGDLYYGDQVNMAKGIRYRFAYFGNTPDKFVYQLSGFTAFYNPDGDSDFDQADWDELTHPSFDLSSSTAIIDEVYSRNIEANDGKYLYWWEEGEVITDRSRWPGQLGTDYIQTKTVRGVPFYFTGIPNIQNCAMREVNCK